MKPAVARAAVAAGATIWNDVTALRHAPDSLATAAELGCDGGADAHAGRAAHDAARAPALRRRRRRGRRLPGRARRGRDRRRRGARADLARSRHRLRQDRRRTTSRCCAHLEPDRRPRLSGAARRQPQELHRRHRPPAPRPRTASAARSPRRSPAPGPAPRWCASTTCARPVRRLRSQAAIEATLDDRPRAGHRRLRLRRRRRRSRPTSRRSPRSAATRRPRSPAITVQNTLGVHAVHPVPAADRRRAGAGGARRHRRRRDQDRHARRRPRRSRRWPSCWRQPAIPLVVDPVHGRQGRRLLLDADALGRCCADCSPAPPSSPPTRPRPSA